MTPATLDRLLWRTARPVPDHPQTRRVDTPVSRIRLRDSGGNGPTVLFLCDPPVTVEAYGELIDRLGGSFRVLVLELPGFGFSKASSSRAYGFAEAVGAVEAAVLDLDPGPVMLCGPCICGFVAIELVRRGRLYVAGVVLLQTPDLAGMLAWTRRMDPKGLLRTPYLGQLLVRASAQRLTQFWFKYATGKTFDHASLAGITLQALAAGASYPLASMLQRWTSGPRDGGLDIPALIIWGKQDRSHGHTDSACTRKHVRQGELLEFDDCGHFPELEQPDRFCKAAIPFFHACFESRKLTGNARLHDGEP